MNTKKLALLLFLALANFTAYSQISFGDPNKINDGWKFILKDSVDYKNAAFDDSKWQSVDLPHDWSVKGQLSPTLASCTGYLPGGIGWYRKNLVVPQDKKGQKVYLYFEGVYNRSEVFINGHSLGKRDDCGAHCAAASPMAGSFTAILNRGLLRP